jgi:gluconolactonase
MLLFAATAMGQGVEPGGKAGQPRDPVRTPGVRGLLDPKRDTFLAAHCKKPPPSNSSRRPVSNTPFESVISPAIPGVIAGGQRWKLVWQEEGNADGIVGFDDGSVWIPWQEGGSVVKVNQAGQASEIYTDTYSGAALAANARGQVFIAERSLDSAVWMLQPKRRLLANRYNGEPLDCLGSFIFDIAADSKGGVYMTMGRIYYINAKGTVSGPFGPIAGNGLILSPDEKTFYATGRLSTAGTPEDRGALAEGIVAFDVQVDGSLTHPRQLVDICMDGLTVDANGRIYCAGARVPDPHDPTKSISGIGVISPEGKILGLIPEPRALNTLAFGGPDKKTLYGLVSRPINLVAIPMIAEGNRTRPK